MVYCLTSLLFFDISLFYYINFQKYSSSNLKSFVSELFFGEVFETLVTLFPIESPVVSAVFWVTPFDVVLIASVADCLAWSISFWLYLLLKFLLTFLPVFWFIFLAKDKNSKISRLNLIFCHFYILHFN